MSPPDSVISVNTDVSQLKNKIKSPRTPRSPANGRQQASPYDSEAGSDYESYDDEEEVGEEESHLITHTRVYALAEKYDIPSLKELAQSKFEMAMPVTTTPASSQTPSKKFTARPSTVTAD